MAIDNITWESLREPGVLAAMVFVIMLLLIKPLIELIYLKYWNKNHPGEEPPQDVPPLAVITNFCALLLAMLLSWFRLNPIGRDAWGEMTVVGVVAWALATGGYEGVKNAGKALGVNITGLARQLWNIPEG